MKKNVVLLVIDSLTAKSIYGTDYNCDSMPFLKKLASKGISATNYYSEGPHTEFGLQALLTGMHTLDDSASIRRLVYAKKTIFDYYYEAGYEISNVTLPALFYPKRFYGIMHDYFTQGDSFIETLFWRLNYYVGLYQCNKLTEQDFIDLVGCFDDSFNSYLNFLDIDNHPKESYILCKNRIADKDFKVRYNDVKSEYDKFLKDKSGYVHEILKHNGKLPNVLMIDDNDTACEVGTYSDKTKKLFATNRKFFRGLSRRQIISTLFDSRLSIKKLCSSLVDYIKGNEHLYIGQMSARFKSYKSLQFKSLNREHIDSSSLKTQLLFLAELLEKNKNKEKPDFIYFHSISQHDPTQWLSLDSDNDEIQRELLRAEELVKKTKNYKGYWAYRLGQRYVDECIELFFKELEAKGILNDTIIVITADHGSSVSDNPIRSARSFNNCHSELYHVPLLIYDKTVVQKKYCGYYTHKDLIPTLLELCGLNQKYEGRGMSILDDNYSPNIALSERTDSGTPALLHKDAIYTVRNKHYLLEYRANIFEDFEKGEIMEVYDLIKDPDELKNIVGTIDKKKIKDLLETVRKRHMELAANYNDWLKLPHGHEE